MRYADARCEVVEGTDAEGMGTYTFIGPCVITGKLQRVTVKAPDLFRYRQGDYIQNCFPYLDKGQREFLISGTSDEGWNQLFGESQEDDEQDE